MLKQEEEEKLRQQEQQNKLDEELAKKLHLELNKAALNANLNSPESPKQNRVMTRNRKNQLNKYGMSKSYANLNSLMSTPSSVPAGKSSSKIFRTGGKNSGSSQKATGVPKNQNNASAFNSVTEKGNAENLPITESEKENFQIPEQSSRASGSKKVNTRHRRTSRKVLAPKIFNSASAVRPESLKLTKSSSVKRRLNEMTFSPESIHELQSSVKDLRMRLFEKIRWLDSGLDFKIQPKTKNSAKILLL